MESLGMQKLGLNHGGYHGETIDIRRRTAREALDEAAQGVR